jgi:PAS domain S-box-containing protein
MGANEPHSSNVGGEPASLGLIEDITDLKLAEAELREKEKTIYSLLRNSEDIVVGINRQHQHFFANDSLYKATGFTPEQYLGKTNEEIGMPEELCSFWRTKHESVFQTGLNESFTFSFETVDKVERIFQAIVVPELNEANEVDRVFSYMRDITILKQAEAEKDALISKLEEALSEIKELRGFIPICANCKKIRDDDGFWSQVEEYIQDRTDAKFSHSICPDCAKKLYPDFYKE